MSFLPRTVVASPSGQRWVAASALLCVIVVTGLAGCARGVSAPDPALLSSKCNEIAQATVLWLTDWPEDAKAGFSVAEVEVLKVVVTGTNLRAELLCSVRYVGPTMPCKSFSPLGLSKALVPGACQSDLVTPVALTLVEHHDGSQWVLDSYQAKFLPPPVPPS